MTQKFNSSEEASEPQALQSACENLSKLKNEELHCELKNRVAEERKLTHQILQIIIEIDLRKLYLPMACSSLFDYLVRRDRLYSGQCPAPNRCGANDAASSRA
ncbi:MAG: hypothetical protein IPK04_15125 [Bdellovibrionales bacterium]|nr:hypothetical protein [Bdellovibrionales bacterium]